MELFAAACVLSRWDAELQSAGSGERSEPGWDKAAEYFLRGLLGARAVRWPK